MHPFLPFVVLAPLAPTRKKTTFRAVVVQFLWVSRAPFLCVEGVLLRSAGFFSSELGFQVALRYWLGDLFFHCQRKEKMVHSELLLESKKLMR